MAGIMAILTAIAEYVSLAVAQNHSTSGSLSIKPAQLPSQAGKIRRPKWQTRARSTPTFVASLAHTKTRDTRRYLGRYVTTIAPSTRAEVE